MHERERGTESDAPGESLKTEIVPFEKEICSVSEEKKEGREKKRTLSIAAGTVRFVLVPPIGTGRPLPSYFSRISFVEERTEWRGGGNLPG